MHNFFPGMNPYLEQPQLWHQVHNRLIVAIADDLTPQIVPKYRVSIEERVYTSVDETLVVGIADVAGQPMPILGSAGSGYSILVSRKWQRPEADLYVFGLKDPIPTFPIPLRQGEPEPVVGLQKLLNEVYARARFDLAIDYSQPVKPSLSPEETAWIAQIRNGGVLPPQQSLVEFRQRLAEL